MEDKSPNNGLLVLIFPAEGAEPVPNVGASVDAVVKRAPVQPSACRNVRSEVAKVQDNLHTGVNDRPNMSSKPGPSGTTGGEQVTYEEGYLGSTSVEIQERDVVSSFEQQFVDLAHGENCNVIGKRPEDAPCSRGSSASHRGGYTS